MRSPLIRQNALITTPNGGGENKLADASIVEANDKLDATEAEREETSPTVSLSSR